MDISDFLPLLIAMLVAALAWTSYRVAGRLKRRLRLSVRIVSSTIGVMAVAGLILLSLVQVGCSRHAPPLKSPDGKHVAVLNYYLQGALGADYAKVNVRPWWSPYAENVYFGLGEWDFKNSTPSGAGSSLA